MARLNPFDAVLFVLMLSLSALSYAQCNSNDPKAPCFSNNSDILDGRTALLPNDDLTMNGLFQFEPYGRQVNPLGVDSPTVNSSIQPGIDTLFSAIGTQPTSNFIEIVGQMFTVTTPQTVSAVSGASWGQGNAFLEGVGGSEVTIPVMESLAGFLATLWYIG